MERVFCCGCLGVGLGGVPRGYSHSTKVVLSYLAPNQLYTTRHKLSEGEPSVNVRVKLNKRTKQTTHREPRPPTPRESAFFAKIYPCTMTTMSYIPVYPIDPYMQTLHYKVPAKIFIFNPQQTFLIDRI